MIADRGDIIVNGKLVEENRSGRGVSTPGDRDEVCRVGWIVFMERKEWV